MLKLSKTTMYIEHCKVMTSCGLTAHVQQECSLGQSEQSL